LTHARKLFSLYSCVFVMIIMIAQNDVARSGIDVSEKQGGKEDTLQPQKGKATVAKNTNLSRMLKKKKTGVLKFKFLRAIHASVRCYTGVSWTHQYACPGQQPKYRRPAS
jgi:hypothetical protein